MTDPSRSARDARADLKPLIARRKAVDLAFALLGLVLVLGSLSILAVLFGQLLRDGAGRLVASHEVKPGSYAPGRFEIVGTLRRQDTGTAVTFEIERDPLVLSNAPAVSANLAELAGKAKPGLLILYHRSNLGGRVRVLPNPEEAFLVEVGSV